MEELHQLLYYTLKQIVEHSTNYHQGVRAGCAVQRRLYCCRLLTLLPMSPDKGSVMLNIVVFFDFTGAHTRKVSLKNIWLLSSILRSSADRSTCRCKQC
jgi:hypothetical protein